MGRQQIQYVSTGQRIAGAPSTVTSLSTCAPKSVAIPVLNLQQIWFIACDSADGCPELRAHTASAKESARLQEEKHEIDTLTRAKQHAANRNIKHGEGTKTSAKQDVETGREVDRYLGQFHGFKVLVVSVLARAAFAQEREVQDRLGARSGRAGERIHASETLQRQQNALRVSRAASAECTHTEEKGARRI
eukprot:3783772-Rhodomonas_salina.1